MMVHLNRFVQIIKIKPLIGLILLVWLIPGCTVQQNKKLHDSIQRFGQLMLIETSEIDYVEGLQIAISSDVLDELKKAHIDNYSLFLKDLGDSLISLFRYLEYTGTDFQSEMSLLRMNPVIQKWESYLENVPMNDILPGGDGNHWKDMDEVFNFKGSPYNPDDADKQPYGMVIGLRPEFIDSYTLLHKHAWPEVLEAIDKGNIRNYSIYLHEIRGGYYLFSYFEYIGTNFDADMAMVDSDPVTIAWMKFTDKACQLPLTTRADGEWWARMRAILNPQEQY